MSLASGSTLGNYQVLGLLGAGGMGEVYRATDAKLGRDVAIKVLPPEFARDPQRLARFEREARVLAQLNHPNIAAIYGFENVDGVPFLVLEYVPGETVKGPMPAEQAMEVATQIAAAMEEAHGKGVVHRDLKPANIKITPQGKVKVLDFGLAKAFSNDASEGDPTRSPTLSALATRAGTILGTAAYMSPEQARGKPLDKRTDVWSFGCVLYEMLTGEQTFTGETVTDVLSAVVSKEPDWSKLPAGAPARVERLLRMCLEKDAGRRLRDIGDAWMAEEPLPAVAARKGGGSGKERLIAWGVAGAMALAVAALGIAVWRMASAPRPVTRAVVTLPPTDRLPTLGNTVVAISADGARLVYAARRGARTQLYLRKLDQLEAAPMPGTEDAVEPFFSPDGEWVGFFSGGKLKKVLVTGGAALTLCDSTVSRGAAWGPDDTIVFTPNATGSGAGLWRVSANGGTPQELTKPDAKNREISHRWPQFLPGGKAVLFTAYTGGSGDESRIAVLRLDTGERGALFEGATYGRYIPTGHLVYSRAGGLLAAPFDPARLQLRGRQFPILEGVRTATGGVAQFAFADTGSLVYVPGSAAVTERSLVWVDRKGTATPLTQTRRYFFNPRLSRDGRQVAVSASDGGSADIWIHEAARDTLTRLTFDPGLDRGPVWTPDGKRVAYESDKGGPGIYWKPADGSGPDERLTTSSSAQRPVSFSPDGKWLAFTEIGAGGTDILVLPMEGERKPRPFLQTPFTEALPKFSPDGRWIAYISNESGLFQTYVQPFPGPGGKWQVSTDGGSEPVWSRNGRELFYRNGDRMMAVDIAPGPSFSAGKPRLLFEGRYFAFGGSSNYDVGADGRFLMIQETTPEAGVDQINLVLNWFEEVKQRK